MTHDTLPLRGEGLIRKGYASRAPKPCRSPAGADLSRGESRRNARIAPVKPAPAAAHMSQACGAPDKSRPYHAASRVRLTDTGRAFCVSPRPKELAATSGVPAAPSGGAHPACRTRRAAACLDMTRFLLRLAGIHAITRAKIRDPKFKVKEHFRLSFLESFQGDVVKAYKARAASKTTVRSKPVGILMFSAPPRFGKAFAYGLAIVLSGRAFECVNS